MTEDASWFADNPAQSRRRILTWADRFRGAMLGGAVGDALGAGVRTRTTWELQHWFGQQGVIDYLPIFGRRGAATDLSQLTVFTLEALLRAKAVNGDSAEWLPTPVVRTNHLRWLHTQGVPWEYAMSGYLQTHPEPSGWLLERPELFSTRNPAGDALSGLGKLAQQPPMTDPGFGAPQARPGFADCIVWAAPTMVWGMSEQLVLAAGADIAKMLTDDRNVHGAAGFHADVLSQLIQGGIGLWDAVTTSNSRLSSLQPGGNPAVAVSRTVHAAMFATRDGRRPTPAELDTEFDTEQAPGELGVALAAVASTGSYADAVLVAVNQSADSSVTASLAGQLAGALYGPDSIPRHWLEELELRDVFETLCADTTEAFAPPPPPPPLPRWAQRYVADSQRQLELGGSRTQGLPAGAYQQEPARPQDAPDSAEMTMVIDLNEVGSAFPQEETNSAPTSAERPAEPGWAADAGPLTEQFARVSDPERPDRDEASFEEGSGHQAEGRGRGPEPEPFRTPDFFDSPAAFVDPPAPGDTDEPRVPGAVSGRRDHFDVPAPEDGETVEPEPLVVPGFAEPSAVRESFAAREQAESAAEALELSAEVDERADADASERGAAPEEMRSEAVYPIGMPSGQTYLEQMYPGEASTRDWRFEDVHPGEELHAEPAHLPPRDEETAAEPALAGSEDAKAAVDEPSAEEGAVADPVVAEGAAPASADAVADSGESEVVAGFGQEDETWFDDSRPDELPSDELRPDELRSDELRSDELRSDELRSDELRSEDEADSPDREAARLDEVEAAEDGSEEPLRSEEVAEPAEAAQDEPDQPDAADQDEERAQTAPRAGEGAELDESGEAEDTTAGFVRSADDLAESAADESAAAHTSEGQRIRIEPAPLAAAAKPVASGGHAKVEGPDWITPSLTERVLGCLLGGALGDALGADLEFVSAEQITERFGPNGPRGLREAYGVHGAITDDTQMTLFTAEGLIRASVAQRTLGVEDPLPEVQLAYQRWLHTQGVEWEFAAGPFRSDHPVPDGWLVGVRGLFATRAPGKTVFRALSRFADGHPAGSIDQPVNNSKGCGGAMRAAPAALYSPDPPVAFDLAARTAALTHGHPSGYLSAGAMAVIVQQALLGQSLDDGVWLALQVLETWEGHEETSALLKKAVELASDGVPTPQQIEESLGGGWVGEEALAIAVCAALVGGDDVERALSVAVHHSGDSDSVGAICGNIVGALLGVAALPVEWLADLELRDVVEQMALDCVAQFGGDDYTARPVEQDGPVAEVSQPVDADWNERYPVRPLGAVQAGSVPADGAVDQQPYADPEPPAEQEPPAGREPHAEQDSPVEQEAPAGSGPRTEQLRTEQLRHGGQTGPAGHEDPPTRLMPAVTDEGDPSTAAQEPARQEVPLVVRSGRRQPNAEDAAAEHQQPPATEDSPDAQEVPDAQEPPNGQDGKPSPFEPDTLRQWAPVAEFPAPKPAPRRISGVAPGRRHDT